MLLLSTKGGQRTVSGGEQGVEGTEQDTGAQWFSSHTFQIQKGRGANYRHGLEFCLQRRPLSFRPEAGSWLSPSLEPHTLELARLDVGKQNLTHTHEFGSSGIHMAAASRIWVTHFSVTCIFPAASMSYHQQKHTQKQIDCHISSRTSCQSSAREPTVS